MLPYTISNNSITILIKGIPQVIDKSHPNYTKIYYCIKKNFWDKIEGLLDISSSVKSFGKGNITVKGGVIFYKDKELHNYVGSKILDFMKEGIEVTYLINFLEKLYQNPSYRAVQELYQFLEAGNIPITEDGDFVVYKKVSEDFKDLYTKTFDNTVGAIVEMPRNEVDEDSNRTCSKGLHVCSFDYLQHFGNSKSKVVACKVNPIDVVAIPTDYNSTKMRVCRYEVIEDVSNSFKNFRNILTENYVYKEISELK